MNELTLQVKVTTSGPVPAEVIAKNMLAGLVSWVDSSERGLCGDAEGKCEECTKEIVITNRFTGATVKHAF